MFLNSDYQRGAVVKRDGTDRLVSLFEDEDRYIIPTYQRGYSWETEHVTELLDDLYDVYDDGDDDRQHFFGTVLVTDHDTPNVMKVIDGQQRLTTVVLFLTCARNYFFGKKDKSEKAKERCKRLEEYIKRGKQETLVLKLSRTNKELFNELVLPRDLNQPCPETYSKSNDSNERLTNAYVIIQNWIKREGVGDDDAAMELIYNYVQTLLNKFVIYKYCHSNEADAYAMFNLVNNRGASLDESDLIKNYLFTKMVEKSPTDEELDEYDEKWDKIRHNVTSKKRAGYQLNRFFYHYLSTFHSDKGVRKKSNKGVSMCLKQKNMHETFRKLVGIPHGKKEGDFSGVLDPKILINDIKKWSSILDDLRNPTKNEFERNNIVHYLEKIKDVKAVFVYPAILAGYREYWNKNKRSQFEALVMMCFKYHIRVKVIGTSMSVSAYQEIMCNITNKIINGVSVGTIINDLITKEEEYPSDNRVRQNLLELRISSAKLAKALLEEAEYGHSDERSLANASIEHIMPRNISKWNDIDSGDLSLNEYRNKYVSMLGNQTLLSKKKNISFSNSGFDVKVKEYEKEEKYKITRSIPDYADKDEEGKLVWNAKAIKGRQKALTESILETIDLTKISVGHNLGI